MNMVHRESIKSLLEKIRSAYELQTEHYIKSCEQVITIGTLLLQADTLVTSDEDELSFLEALPFEASTVSKYKQIAKHPVLSDLSLLRRLPSAMSTLYEFSKSSEQALLDGINSGEIHPTSTRADASKFARENPKAAHAGRGAPVKESTAIDFSQVKISTECTAEEQDAILQELLKIRTKFPGLILKVSKLAGIRYKDALRTSAETALDEIIASQDSEKQKLANLVSHAILDSRKNKGILSSGFKWRTRLVNVLNVDKEAEIRESAIYKFARREKIVTRYTPIGEVDPVAGIWAKVIDFCEGDKSAIAKLRSFLGKDSRKSGARLIQAKKLGHQMLAQMETL